MIGRNQQELQVKDELFKSLTKQSVASPVKLDESSSFARTIEESMRFAKQNPFESYKPPSRGGDSRMLSGDSRRPGAPRRRGAPFARGARREALLSASARLGQP